MQIMGNTMMQIYNGNDSKLRSADRIIGRNSFVLSRVFFIFYFFYLFFFFMNNCGNGHSKDKNKRMLLLASTNNLLSNLCAKENDLINQSIIYQGKRGSSRL